MIDTRKTFMDKVMACKTKEDAQALISSIVKEAQWESGEPMITKKEARSIVLDNIGYFTGYMSTEERHRILDLFETEHPLFGRTDPTPEEAFAAGQEVARIGFKEFVERRKAKDKANAQAQETQS